MENMDNHNGARVDQDDDQGEAPVGNIGPGDPGLVDPVRGSSQDDSEVFVNFGRLGRPAPPGLELGGLNPPNRPDQIAPDAAQQRKKCPRYCSR